MSAANITFAASVKKNMKIVKIILAALLIVGVSSVKADSSLIVPPGKNVIVSVTANGSMPFTYQWYKNSTILAGEMKDQLLLNGVSISNNGTYTVIVSNDAGSATSDKAILSVITLPVISPLVNITVTVGNSASFTANITGAISYQWYKNSVAIAGATSATYTIATTVKTDAGAFYVVAINAAGSTTSNTVALIVNSIPPTLAPISISSN